MSQKPAALPPADDLQLEAPNTPVLQSGEDLAKHALAAASASTPKVLPAARSAASGSGDQDEVEASNQVAEALSSLQSVIERNADQLDTVRQELREQRNMLKNYFDNDTQLGAAQEQVNQLSESVKTRRSQLQNDPQVVSLKNKIGELNEMKKEVEEALSNHLINYYSMTNSTSFDTSDGDQREFSLRAQVKGRHKD